MIVAEKMKNRRNFIKKAARGLAALGLFSVGKKSMAAGREKITGTTLVHHVYFWLKEPENEAHKKQLLEALNKLVKIKTIKMSHIGVPASTEEREVVDSSYAVSYMVMFDDQAGHDAYQVDPVHLKFVEENQHLWSKVVVYDSVGK